MKLIDEKELQILDNVEFADWRRDKITTYLTKYGTNTDLILSTINNSENSTPTSSEVQEFTFLMFNSFAKNFIKMVFEQMNASIKMSNNNAKYNEPCCSSSEFDYFLSLLLLMGQFVDDNKEVVFGKIMTLYPKTKEVMTVKRLNYLLSHFAYADADNKLDNNCTAIEEFIEQALIPFQSTCCNMNQDNLCLDDLAIGSYATTADQVAQTHMFERKAENQGYKAHVLATVNLGVILHMQLAQKDDQGTCSTVKQMLLTIKKHLGIKEGKNGFRAGVVDLDRGYASDKMKSAISEAGFPSFAIMSTNRKHPFNINKFKSLDEMYESKVRNDNPNFVPDVFEYGHDFVYQKTNSNAGYMSEFICAVSHTAKQSNENTRNSYGLQKKKA